MVQAVFDVYTKTAIGVRPNYRIAACKLSSTYIFSQQHIVRNEGWAYLKLNLRFRNILLAASTTCNLLSFLDLVLYGLCVVSAHYPFFGCIPNASLPLS